MQPERLTEQPLLPDELEQSLHSTALLPVHITDGEELPRHGSGSRPVAASLHDIEPTAAMQRSIELESYVHPSGSCRLEQLESCVCLAMHSSSVG